MNVKIETQGQSEVRFNPGTNAESQLSFYAVLYCDFDLIEIKLARKSTESFHRTQVP